MAGSAEQLIAEWRAAALCRDAERLCSLYADNAVVVDLCGEVHHGSAAHRCAGSYLAHCGPSTDGRVFARSVEADDIAVVAGMWQAASSIGLMVMRREPDGSWCVLIDLLGEVS
jgi:ketosteroid isomerase-like protein